MLNGTDPKKWREPAPTFSCALGIWSCVVNCREKSLCACFLKVYFAASLQAQNVFYTDMGYLYWVLVLLRPAVRKLSSCISSDQYLQFLLLSCSCNTWLQKEPVRALFNTQTSKSLFWHYIWRDLKNFRSETFPIRTYHEWKCLTSICLCSSSWCVKSWEYHLLSFEEALWR